MISVKNVTMKFNLGIEASSFKETFISTVIGVGSSSLQTKEPFLV